MNALVTQLHIVSRMTSSEIAELVDKRHDNVKRTIETLASSGAIRLPQIEDSEIINNLGLRQTVRAYVFEGEQGKRDSIVVVAQLSPQFTARLVDRWIELERRSLPQTLPEALRLAADLAEQKAEVEHQLTIAAPKAAGFDRISATDSDFGIREAAKSLQITQTVLVNMLVDRKWAFRDGKSRLTAHADKIKAGYLTEKITAPMRAPDGQERVFPTMRLTAKGVARLSAIIEKQASKVGVA